MPSLFGGFKMRTISARQLVGSVASLVLPHLSRASGRPRRELSRSLIDYTKSYEEKVAGSRGSK